MLAERTIGGWIGLLELTGRNSGETEPHHLASACFHCELVICRDFGSCAVRVYGIRSSLHDKVVDSIFHIRYGVCGAEQALTVGFVFSEEKSRLAVTVEEPVAQLSAGSCGYAGILHRLIPPDHRTAVAPSLCPRIAEPQRRQDRERRSLGSAIPN